jgi:hypothetical protein
MLYFDIAIAVLLPLTVQMEVINNRKGDQGDNEPHPFGVRRCPKFSVAVGRSGVPNIAMVHHSSLDGRRLGAAVTSTRRSRFLNVDQKYRCDACGRP